MQYKMNRKLLFIGGIVAVLLIAGGLFLSAQSNRYAVIENSCVLDKWSGSVTYQGQYVYNIKGRKIKNKDMNRLFKGI